jgi:hypothetical protein
MHVVHKMHKVHSLNIAASRCYLTTYIENNACTILFPYAYSQASQMMSQQVAIRRLRPLSEGQHSAQEPLNMSAGQNRKCWCHSNLRRARRKKSQNMSGS